MNKHNILKNAYKELNLDFELDSKNHLHIEVFDVGFFAYNIQITTEGTIICDFPSIMTCAHYSCTYSVKKGLKSYMYHNIYELLLWYYYYSIKNKHIKRKKYNHCNQSYFLNQAYFSRIPVHYRNINPKLGLNIIKEILDQIIIENNGVPKYYDENILTKILSIKNSE